MTEFTEEWIVGPGETAFYANVYAPADGQPPRGAVLAVHGFIEHVARFQHVFSQWRARGFFVLAYDQRGFGKTALDKAKRSKHSAWGRFSGAEQLADIEFFLRNTKQRVPAGTPLFLFGHSMGGAEVISFAANVEAPSPSREELIDGLAGVIASSPLIAQTTPAPRWKRWAGTQASHLLPHFNFPAPVAHQDLCKDKTVQDAFVRDPLIQQKASLRGLRDMLNRCDDISTAYYQNWPVELPILFVHGNQDKISSYGASKELYEKLTANDKSFSTYEGGFHELHNEPDDKDRVIEECIAWVEKHLVKNVEASEPTEVIAEEEPEEDAEPQHEESPQVVTEIPSSKL